MNLKKHDINSSGFNVDPELLSHDLALLKVQLSESFKPGMNVAALYDLYTEELDLVTTIVEDKIRSDSPKK